MQATATPDNVIGSLCFWRMILGFGVGERGEKEEERERGGIEIKKRRTWVGGRKGVGESGGEGRGERERES